MKGRKMQAIKNWKMPMVAAPNRVNERSPVADSPQRPGSSGRTFQYSLGALMLVMTLLAPVIAAASGSLGDAMQYLAGFLLVAACLAPFFLMLCCPVLLAQSIEQQRSEPRAPSTDVGTESEPPRRRFQFSLRTLLMIAAIVPPIVGLFSGAFGETAQAVVLVTLFGSFVIVLGSLAILGGAIVLVTTVLLIAVPLVWLLDLVGKARVTLCQRRRSS